MKNSFEEASSLEELEAEDGSENGVGHDCIGCEYWQDVADPKDYYPEFECVLPSNLKCPYGVK